MTIDCQGLLNDVLSDIEELFNCSINPSTHANPTLNQITKHRNAVIKMKETITRLQAFIDDVDKDLSTKLEAANNELDKLIDTGGKSFTMQVPARPDKDTDLVFATAIRAAQMLADAVDLKSDKG